jgi:hypothetical protein
MLGGPIAPSLVKTIGPVSLLSYEFPKGTGFVIVQDYGELGEQILFPSRERPSVSGDAPTYDAEEAFSELERIAAMYTSLPEDPIALDGRYASFDDFDDGVLSYSFMPNDLVAEIQRKGYTATGSVKTALDLGVRFGMFSRFFGPSEDELRIAKLRYASYPTEVRKTALKDMRESILAKYLTGELVSSLIMTDREKRAAYQKAIAEGYMPDRPRHEMIRSQATVDSVPEIAFEVEFVDQEGNSVKGLPYEVTARGSLNFQEALNRTSMGSNPGGFSSGTSLTEQGMAGMQMMGNDAVHGSLVAGWSGRPLNPNSFYHLLYSYRSSGSPGMPRGVVRLSVTTSRSVASRQDWGNERLMVYNEPTNASGKRNGTPVKPEGQMVLFTHNYRLTEGDEPQRMKIQIPVYVQPLPMHLVKLPDGKVVSKWSMVQDIGELPRHQKVSLTMKVLRPKASEKWIDADRMLPDDRNGYNDKRIQYEEFVSPAGRAAYRDSETSATPASGVRFVLRPNNANQWVTSKQMIFMQPDSSGTMKAEVAPGRYTICLLTDIKGDGTTGLRIVEATNDPDYPMSMRFDELDPNTQAAVKQKFDGAEIKVSTRFAPESIELGVIEAPAAYYYRSPTSSDSTPLGIVGLKMVRGGSIADVAASRFKEYQLRTEIPAIPAGKEAGTGSIYDVLGVDHPGIQNGWPVKDFDTDQTIFDTCTVMLAPDSVIDLSMLDSFERRYEAGRESGGRPTARLLPPAVGQIVEYKGFNIEHLYFDAAVGPNLKNRSAALVRSGTVHEYEMGRMNRPFYEVGMVRCMVYYPQSGTLRRKITLPTTVNVNTTVAMTSVHSGTAGSNRVFYFDVKASPEAGILSGRWVPLESIMEGGPMMMQDESRAFNSIIQAIDKGGRPITGSPPWNNFWSSTADAWMLGGSDQGGMPTSDMLSPGNVIAGGELNFNKQSASAIASHRMQQGQFPITQGNPTMAPAGAQGIMSGVVTEYEDELGRLDLDEILYAPVATMDADNNEDFGFIGGE